MCCLERICLDEIILIKWKVVINNGKLIILLDGYDQVPRANTIGLDYMSRSGMITLKKNIIK